TMKIGPKSSAARLGIVTAHRRLRYPSILRPACANPCPPSGAPGNLAGKPSPKLMGLPELRDQEIQLSDPESVNMFRPGPDKPFLATPAAIAMYTHEVILACLGV